MLGGRCRGWTGWVLLGLLALPTIAQGQSRSAPVGSQGGARVATSTAEGQGAAPVQQDLTESERAALEAGELVTRPQEQRRGNVQLLGGMSYQVIDERPEVVWQALMDTSLYPRMLPVVQEARLLSAVDNHRKVEVQQGRGFIHVGYVLDLEIDEGAQEIAFRIDQEQPHDLNAAWGLYSLRPYGSDRTLLAYAIMADIGHGLLRSLVRDSVHEWMLKVPWTIKRFMEGSYRKLRQAQPPTLGRGQIKPGQGQDCLASKQKPPKPGLLQLGGDTAHPSDACEVQ